MVSTDAKLAGIVTRFALAISFVVATALPVGYAIKEFGDMSDRMMLRAKAKAASISRLVTSNPELWKYSEHRLQDVLEGGVMPLGTDSVQVYDVDGSLVTHAGNAPPEPQLRRSAAIYDAGRVAGSVEVTTSLHGLIYRTAVAALFGLLLGSSIFVLLRVLPLRALKRVTHALFEQKERVEVTLHSIGDAVITTDACECVEYMNPVAERLTGWALSDAKGAPLDKVLQLVDGITGEPVANPLRQAIAEKRVVSLDGSIELIRQDATRIAIEDSAAPIRDSQNRIAGGVLIFRDVSAARSFAKQRSWEASHDILTGLFNRREFEDRIEVSLASAKNSGSQHVVCYLDLDQFKVINETCGHAAGDDLLKNIAALFRSRIGESDTLARLGGDEFALLLHGCSLQRGQFIASDLLDASRDFRFTWEDKTFTVSVSIGFCLITAENTGVADILGSAHTACYWAKENGRNRVAAYRAGDPNMTTRRSEMGWISRINAALAQDRFVLYHQTYLALNASMGPRKHLEVLVRMIDEEGRVIPPGQFLPAAERYNLMSSIDRWVIKTMFANYRVLLSQRRGEVFTCAINLSGTSLNAEGFLDFVREQAREHVLPPNSICFEVTETAAINNLAKAAEFIRECKAMGFLFALDDFGSGTSSFGYLKNLPVDYLKIDGAFVKNLEHDPIDRAMTETINRIGHIMGIKTVAEFAENATIVQLLKNMGVDYAQGYAISIPSPLFAERVVTPIAA